MIWLLVGLALWWGGHLWIRTDLRAAMGRKGRGISALIIAAGVVLMIIGFRTSATLPVWDPPVWTRYLNNLLVLVAFYLFAVSGAKTRLHRHMRHPQLIGLSLWAVAHLMVNGDLSSIILFGGLLLWALVEIAIIGRTAPDWTPPPRGPLRKEFTSVLATVVIFGIVGAVHAWLGHNPFG